MLMGSMKYRNVDFWQGKMMRKEALWSGLLDGQSLYPSSLIIEPTILNAHSNQFENNYAVYPNVKAVLGFLQYIYLPTAVGGLFAPDSKDYLLFTDNLSNFLERQKEQYQDKIEEIEKMESLYDELDQLWNLTERTCLHHLLQWSEKFNSVWLNRDGVVLTFRIYTSPGELASEKIEVYEKDFDLEMLKEDLGLSRHEFITLISKGIFKDDEMKQKFTEILIK